MIKMTHFNFSFSFPQ